MPEQERQRLLGVIRQKDDKIEKLNGKIEVLKNKIKVLEAQCEKELEKCKKEIEDLKSKKDESEREVAELRNEIEELRKKLDEKGVRLASLEKELEESKSSHQKEIDKIKECHKKDIDELKDNSEKRRQEIIENHNKEMEKLNEMSRALEMTDEQVKILKDENKTMKTKLKENKKIISCHEKDHQKLYLGQICSDLQANLYRYVLPDQYVDDCPYKFKNIEEHINDDDMLDETEKNEAKERYEELQKKIDWKKLKRLTGAIKLLQDQRNQVAHPKYLNEEGARNAAEELKRQGKLKGKIKFENVKEIIDFWAFSKSLLCDRNSNHKYN